MDSFIGDKSEKISKIGNVENYFLNNDTRIPEKSRAEFDKFLSHEVQTSTKGIKVKIQDILEGRGEITFIQLENSLKEVYGEGQEVNTKDGRFSISIGYDDLSLVRATENVQLPHGTTSNGNSNIGESIIDPLGWSSRVVAPSRDYGIFGKIPDLRPGSLEKPNSAFQEEIYKKIMNLRVKLDFKGYALEVNDETGERVIMPVIRIEGGREEFLRFVDGKYIIDHTQSGFEKNHYIETSKSYGVSQ